MTTEVGKQKKKKKKESRKISLNLFLIPLLSLVSSTLCTEMKSNIGKKKKTREGENAGETVKKIRTHYDFNIMAGLVVLLCFDTAAVSAFSALNMTRKVATTKKSK